MAQSPPDLDGPERVALHELALGIEHLYRTPGHLLALHHQLGRGMGHPERARAGLRAGGNEADTGRLRDEVLPVGGIGDRWSYVLVEAFEAGRMATATDVERPVRGELTDGVTHVVERDQRRRWRDCSRRRPANRRTGPAPGATVTDPPRWVAEPARRVTAQVPCRNRGLLSTAGDGGPAPATPRAP